MLLYYMHHIIFATKSKEKSDSEDMQLVLTNDLLLQTSCIWAYYTYTTYFFCKKRHKNVIFQKQCAILPKLQIIFY